MWIEKNQGTTENEMTFGYVGEGVDKGNGNGGFFFTWHPTLAETIASIEADTDDRPVRLTMSGAVRAVRSVWRKESRKECGSLIPSR
jgi:hypothetical protein